MEILSRTASMMRTSASAARTVANTAGIPGGIQRTASEIAIAIHVSAGAAGDRCLTAAPRPGFRLGQLVAIGGVVDDGRGLNIDDRAAIDDLLGHVEQPPAPTCPQG